MSLTSSTTTQVSTAKLDLSLLLKASSSTVGVKRRAEELNDEPTSRSIESIERPETTTCVGTRRVSEASTTSPATTPSLATANTSRQPSIAPISTPPIIERLPMEVQPSPRPMLPALPPLRSPPQMHRPYQMQVPQSMPSGYLTPHYQGLHADSSYPPTKRQRTASPPQQHQLTAPAKRQSKWTQDEDAVIIDLRGRGMKWEDISKHLPGRSAISCRLHYQNYLERRSEWDEEKKNRLARLYERLKAEMWSGLAAELGIPWRAAEAMHWQLGESGMAGRAGVTPFSLAATQTISRSSSYQTQTSQPRPQHYRNTSDPPYERQYSQGRYESQSHHHAPMMDGEEEIVRLTRPPSPVLSRSPREQAKGLLPSMAELDRGLTTAIMSDARRYSAPPRR